MASCAPGNPGEQSVRLKENLEAHLRDLPEAIRNRLRNVQDAFLRHYQDNEGKETAESALDCCTEAQGWYQKIKESHIKQERERLELMDISESGADTLPFLQQELYHWSLMACCLQIAIALKNFQCDFLLLLELIKLPPYYFLKIIEPVVRADVELSESVVVHLCQVQSQIVESVAWASDSPLWKDLKINGGFLPLCQQVMPPSQLEDLKVNIVSVDHSYSLQQFSSSPSGRLSKTIQLFARKVYTLMGNRLRNLCRAMEISDSLRLKIWTCFEHSLVQTNLIMDRHLDQLLLCAIYITVRYNNVEISFKHMVNVYYGQPKANKNVYKSVLISREDGENQSHGSHNLTPITPTTHHPGKELRKDLIYFYTHVYIAEMEAIAKQFEPLPGVETPPLSPYPQRRWQGPKKRLSSSQPIYLSPYYADTQPPFTSAGSYVFKQYPRESLKEISNILKRCTQQDEANEDEPPSRIACMRNETFLQQRVRNVMIDRMAEMDQN